MDDFAEFASSWKERLDRKGERRTVPNIVYENVRFVLVGDHVQRLEPQKTPIDFLIGYVCTCFGKEWAEQELAKPQEQSHPFIDWYRKMRDYQREVQEQQAGPQDHVVAPASNPMRALVQLAWDLMLLENHAEIQDRLLTRLRDRQKFQGARHEVFAASLLVMAGFELTVVDETDNKRKHPEYIAKFRRTGEEIAVEAKSKHRIGILAAEGTAPRDPDRLRLQRLLEDAFAKAEDITLPLLVFVDLNVPAMGAPTPDATWINEITEDIQKALPVNANGKDPFAALVVSNQPYQRAANDEPRYQHECHLVISKKPKMGVRDAACLMALREASFKYANVPRTWEEM